MGQDPILLMKKLSFPVQPNCLTAYLFMSGRLVILVILDFMFIRNGIFYYIDFLVILFDTILMVYILLRLS